MRRFLYTLSLALVTLTSRQLVAQETSSNDEPGEVDALRQELRAQEAAHAAESKRQAEALARLQAQLDDTRRLIEKAAAPQPLVRARNFGLSVTGFVQADFNAFRQSSQDELNPSTGEPLNQTRFLLRRARLRAEVDWSIVGGAIELDANTVNGPQVRPVGAEVSLKWRNPANAAVPYLQLTLGEFKTPFGFEVLQSDKDRLFLERSNTERALFPGEYDLGIRLHGGWRFLRYAIGAMNGDPIGERLFPGRDPNESKDLVGRIGVDFDIFKRLGLAAGFSADYGNGFHKGLPATKDTLVWRDANEDGVVEINEITVIRGQTPQPSSSFQRWAVGGDLELTVRVPTVGELMLYGELVYATNLDRATQLADPVIAGRDLREFGWYVAATQELTKWAQIGIRYDRYDADRDANELRNGISVPRANVYSTLSVAAAIRYPGYARLQLEYQHNTNPLGRDVTGAPASLKDDAFILRGQVQF